MLFRKVTTVKDALLQHRFSEIVNWYATWNPFKSFIFIILLKKDDVLSIYIIDKIPIKQISFFFQRRFGYHI